MARLATLRSRATNGRILVSIQAISPILTGLAGPCLTSPRRPGDNHAVNPAHRPHITDPLPRFRLLVLDLRRRIILGALLLVPKLADRIIPAPHRRGEAYSLILLDLLLHIRLGPLLQLQHHTHGNVRGRYRMSSLWKDSSSRLQIIDGLLTSPWARHSRCCMARLKYLLAVQLPCTSFTGGLRSR